MLCKEELYMLDYNEFVLEQADCMDIITEFDVYCIQEGFAAVALKIIINLPTLIIQLIKSAIRDQIIYLKSWKNSLDAHRVKKADENDEVELMIPDGFGGNVDGLIDSLTMGKNFVNTSYYIIKNVLKFVDGYRRSVNIGREDSFVPIIKEMNLLIDQLHENNEVVASHKAFQEKIKGYDVVRIKRETAMSYYYTMMDFYDRYSFVIKDIDKLCKKIEKKHDKIQNNTHLNVGDTLRFQFEKSYKSLSTELTDTQKHLTTCLFNMKNAAKDIIKQRD